MSKTFVARLRNCARWVLFAWTLALLAPLVVPTQPVVQDNFVILRVCSLMDGVQFVKVPLADYSDSSVKDHIGQLHDSCKCGLNIDHVSILSADFTLSPQNFASARWAIPLNRYVLATLDVHYSSRAPPSFFS